MLVPVTKGAGRVIVALVDDDASVAVEATTPLHNTSLDNKDLIHGCKEGGQTGLEEDEGGAGRLIVAVGRVVHRVDAF